MSNSSRRSFACAPQIRSLTVALSIALTGGASCLGLMEMHSADAATTQPRQRHVHTQNRSRVTAAPHATFADVANGLQRVADRKRPFAAATLHNTIAVNSLTESGHGSIREALENATDGDVIDLHGLSGTIMLTRALEPSARVVIDGPGQDALTLDGSGIDRVINSSHDLKVSNVTIAHGATAGATSTGGCLSITGYLYLSNATISNCKSGDKNTEFAYGGAVFVRGTAYLENASITGSSVTAYHQAAGGALFVAGENTSNGIDAAIKYSTVSGNSATIDASAHQIPNTASLPVMAVGGGIANYYAPTSSTAPFSMVVGSSTVSGNTVIAAGFQNASTSYNYYGNVRGGGVAAMGTSGVLIALGTVQSNSASSNGVAKGGGIYSNSTIFGIGPKVTGNTSASTNYWSYGGGLSAAYINLTGSSLSGNIVTSSCYSCLSLGGGAQAVEATTKYSTISGNSITGSTPGATVDGGGLVAYGSLAVNESTVSGNTASNTAAAYYGYGGGLASQNSIKIQNSTIAFNTASGYGGGIASFGVSMQLDSTIVANNSAIYNAVSTDISSAENITVTGDHDLVRLTSSTLTLPAGTLTADPKLLPLADNGGPTLTHKLDPTSPAIDAGSNPNTNSADQRGYPHDRSFGAAPDIGAYELDTDRIFRDDFETHSTIL